MGGAGVQRSSKFVKYLPEFDFKPIVITSAVAGSNKWTPTDLSLKTDLAEETEVHRLPENPDNQVTSNTKENPKRTEALFQLANKLFGENKISLVYVSLSPFGDLEAAKKIAIRHSVPLVADLRDPWALDEFQSYRSSIHRSLEKKRMGQALIGVDFIIMNTPTSARLLKINYPHLNADRIGWITNGYDQEDFKEGNEVNLLDQSFFNIVHTGTFHTDYALRQKKQKYINILLGRTYPGIDYSGRTPIYLFQAIEKIRREKPEIGKRIKLTLAGVSSDTEEALSSQYGINEITKITGYINHSQSIGFLKSADLLFLPLHQISNKGSSSIVPGKTYEYLASGKTILAAVPEGDAKQFVIDSGTGLICKPTDVENIKSKILNAYEAWENNRSIVSPKFSFIKQFERRNLTERLANVFRKTLEIHYSSI